MHPSRGEGVARGYLSQPLSRVRVSRRLPVKREAAAHLRRSEVACVKPLARQTFLAVAAVREGPVLVSLMHTLQIYPY